MQITTNTIIDIKDVNFRYSNETVLEHIHLTVKKGEFLGLIGPNGSGKTTLIKILLGLLKSNSGTVSLFNQKINQFFQWSKIGYVPQKAGQTSQNFPITVEEVVALGRISNTRIIDIMTSSDRKAINQSLETVQMLQYKHRRISDLSGGQQQRVFIARALVSNPELLILDEPTVGVDTESQTNFYKLLDILNKKHHMTLILISHDIEVVARVVSRIACINQTIVCHGHPKQILNSDFVEKLYGKDLKFIVHEH